MDIGWKGRYSERKRKHEGERDGRSASGAWRQGEKTQKMERKRETRNRRK